MTQMRPIWVRRLNQSLDRYDWDVKPTVDTDMTETPWLELAQIWLGMLVPKALARERRLTYLNGLHDIRYIWKLNYEKIFEKIFATWGRSFSDFFH